MPRICKWVRAKRTSLAFCGLVLLAAGAGVWALAANGDPWPWPYEVWESGNLPRTLSFAEAKAEVEWMVGQEVNMVGTAGAWGEISSQGTPIDVPLAALGDPPPEVVYITYDFYLTLQGPPGGPAVAMHHVSGIPYSLAFVGEFYALYVPPSMPVAAQWGSASAPDPTLSAGLAQTFAAMGETGGCGLVPSVLIRDMVYGGTPWETNPIASWRASANFLYEFKPPPNQPPTAVIAAAPTSGSAPLTVSFNGGASSDPDGTIVDHAWSFGDGGTASGPQASHAYINPGNYTATLTVTDDHGAVGTASTPITVGPSNLPPVAVASANPLTVPLGDAVQFSSTGSYDPEGEALTYSWDFGDQASSAEANPTHTYAKPGTYSVKLTVRDPPDASGTATLTVKVLGIQIIVRPKGAPEGHEGIAIAAGGINSPAHQADVEVRVADETGGPYTVKLSLEGGEGAPTEYTYEVPILGITRTDTFGRGQVRATLKIRGVDEKYVAGVTKAPIAVQADSSGSVKAVLTSSNRLETCRLLASVVVPGQGAIDAAKPIPFEWGDFSIKFSEPCIPLTGKFRIDATLTHHGQPMNGHDLVFYAQEVIADGTTHTFDPKKPKALAAYILVSSKREFSLQQLRSLIPLVKTDAHGRASAWAENVSGGPLDKATFEVLDYSLKK